MKHVHIYVHIQVKKILRHEFLVSNCLLLQFLNERRFRLQVAGLSLYYFFGGHNPRRLFLFCKFFFLDVLNFICFVYILNVLCLKLIARE